jgi:iron complex transport system permease protein
MSAIPSESTGSVRSGHIVLRSPLFDLRLHWRVLFMALVTMGATALIGIWAMTLGPVPIPPLEVFWASIGMSDAQSAFVIQELRLPRVIVAILVGGALAMSGAIFQGLVRNELASPDIIGINTGAAGIGFIFLVITRDATHLPFVLFGGAMVTAAVIYGLSWKGGISPNRLILVGVAVQSMMVAFETFLVRRFPLDDIIWAEDKLLGTVAFAHWGDVATLTISLTLLMPCALALAFPLRALQLGDDTARTIGIPVEWIRFLLMIVGCWLCALAIAMAGLVGFVALMIPHAARMIAGPVSGSNLVFTAALGGLFLLCCDIVAHHFMPVELPLSIVIGAVGAPYFLFLFWRAEVRV